MAAHTHRTDGEPPVLCHLLLLLLLALAATRPAGAVARFAIKSVGARSVVVEMVDAQSVSRFDMRVLLFDLDRLREFRRSELTGARYNAQLFSFDGLLPANWFAFRIEYRLVFAPGSKAASPSGELSTKQVGVCLSRQRIQELIVRTRAEVLSSSGAAQSSAETAARDIEDEVVRFERIQLFPESHQLNVTLSTVFRHRPRLHTLVVAELRCARGTVKPPAVQLPDQGATLSFDLKGVHSGVLSRRNALDRLQCSQLCVFPFVRVEPPKAAEERHAQHRHSFRAREVCEVLQEAQPRGPDAGDRPRLLERHFRTTAASGRAASAQIDASPLALLATLSVLALFPFRPT